MLWGPSRHLGSLTAANWVSFDFNVSYSSCWGYSLINTLKLKIYKRKKLEPPIICFRVGGSFSQNPETTFLLGPGCMHVEHHTASSPRSRGAGDNHCVEMITWEGSPTCILHLHLVDRLSNGTPSHGYPRAQCGIPAINGREAKNQRKMVQIAHGA